ncbi:PTS sugar transporter subunit IIA, partial [Microvirga sp. 3-52]|nr:PTS sugar transporter subunit IIA [Microvirga sp. 3-52]
MIGQVGNKVAHGGPIVAVLGAVDNVVMFFIAAAVGVFVTAFMVNFLKKDVSFEPAVAVAGDTHTQENVEVTPEATTTEGEIRKLTDITNEHLIDVNLQGTTRDDIIDELINKLDANGVLDTKETFREAIFNREAQSSTGIGANIAIPHGKSNAVKRPAVVFGLQQAGVDWNSID